MSALVTHPTSAPVIIMTTIAAKRTAIQSNPFGWSLTGAALGMPSKSLSHPANKNSGTNDENISPIGRMPFSTRNFLLAFDQGSKLVNFEFISNPCKALVMSRPRSP
jgi:hypothetical protein